MKVEHTNITYLKSIASDEAWAVIDLINNGMTIDEAVEAQAEGWMESPFDDEQFDAPYELQQIKPIIKAAVLEELTGSATNLYHYAMAHESAYIRDYEAEDNMGEPVNVRVVNVEGKKFHIVTGDDEMTDDYFYN